MPMPRGLLDGCNATVGFITRAQGRQAGWQDFAVAPIGTVMAGKRRLRRTARPSWLVLGDWWRAGRLARCG